MSGRSSGAARFPIELGKQIQKRAKEQGLHAANMPEEAGGGGLDFLSATLMDRELGKSTWGLVGWVGRPSEILNACEGDQRETYLLPTVRGERKEAFGLTEPNAGSDAMSIQTRATADGSDYLINGSKHFISCVTKPDFVILFTVTGIDKTPKGERKRITCFLVDVGTPGFDIRRGPKPVSHRAYHNYQLSFDGCRVPARNILGEEGKGFELAGQWLSNTRILTAATCCGKAERALQIASEWAATRKQFGQNIGKFQGVSFKLADMATELRAADLLTMQAALEVCVGHDDQQRCGDGEALRIGDGGAGDRPCDPDPRRHGPDGRAAAGDAVAGCAHRAHLGRHQRDSAAHHLARDPAAVERVGGGGNFEPQMNRGSQRKPSKSEAADECRAMQMLCCAPKARGTPYRRSSAVS